MLVAANEGSVLVFSAASSAAQGWHQPSAVASSHAAQPSGARQFNQRRMQLERTNEGSRCSSCSTYRPSEIPACGCE
jgi:hypothetical protein